jgi:CubicO group peptidase (beta-lactamase class C family)
MEDIVRASSLLNSSLLLFFAPLSALAQTVAPADTTFGAVDHLFDRWRGPTTPGCAVGVSRGGRTVLERGYGMANLETATPITPNTIFHAASLAKQVTAMAVMLLVEDGKLSLDDDVRRFVPELPDYGMRITVRHLLTHTSGLRDFFEMLILARGRFEEDRITHADMMDIVARQKVLNFTPGSEYLYTNTGYALLAVIVKRASGKSLRDFAAERIFTPLHMLRTSFQDDFTTLVAGRAAGYAARDSSWRSSAPNYDVYGPTNLLTTVGDLLQWIANFDSTRVGSAAIVRQMTTSAVLANGDSTNYGFGISMANDRGARVEEHEGSDPGFRAYLGRYPDYRLAVAVLCNTRSLNAVALGHDVAGVYLDTALHSPRPFTIAASGTADTASVARRAGVYFQPTRVEVVELSWRDGGLYTARRGGRKLLPLGGNRFQVEGLPVVHTFGPEARSGYVASSLLPGHHPVAFEWRAPVVNNAGSLERYKGDYFSSELNSTWHVAARDSILVLSTGTSQPMDWRPVFADTFVSGQLVIQFTRRGAGVTGFEMSHPRARRLVFTRRAAASVCKACDVPTADRGGASNVAVNSPNRN